MTFTTKSIFAFAITTFAILMTLFSGQQMLQNQLQDNVLFAHATSNEEPNMMRLASDFSEAQRTTVNDTYTSCEDGNADACSGRFQNY